MQSLVALLLIFAATACTSEPWLLWTETRVFLPTPEPKSQYAVMKAYASRKECEAAKEARLAQARKEAEKGDQETARQEIEAKSGTAFDMQSVVGEDGVITTTHIKVFGVDAVSVSGTRYVCLPKSVDPRPK